MERLELITLLNQIAQGVRDEDEGLNILLEATDDERHLFFVDLTMMIQEAHPTSDEVALAVEESGLKPTFTPCILLTRKALSEALAKVRSLPRHEDKKSYRLMMTLFRIADRRRRLTCGPSCSHWWHRDLSDPDTIAELHARLLGH